jgi:hypothetical protein
MMLHLTAKRTQVSKRATNQTNNRKIAARRNANKEHHRKNWRQARKSLPGGNTKMMKPIMRSVK